MKIYIGWDSREDIAYQVARHSILKHNSNLEVIPLRLHELRECGVYTREDDKKGSTEFTISRFLVPFLSEYRDYSMFIDCDVLVLEDLMNIFYEVHSENIVSCVQHDYSPKSNMKMNKQMQHVYPRKNWSSVMVFNNVKCKMLTPDVVNTESPMYLHRMYWAKDKIGKLNNKWNHLAGYYNDKPSLIHYTDGGPWFPEYRDCPFSELWQNELRDMFGLKDKQ